MHKFSSFLATTFLFISAAFFSSAFAEQVAPAKPPCDWLKEVKRTNTWFERDQGPRAIWGSFHSDDKKKPTTKQIQTAVDAVRQSDKVLQDELDDLVNRCGWPTTSGFGDKAPQHAAMIVQHADLPFQERYLPIMESAAAAGEIPSRFVATLKDRVLVKKGLPQMYGSQLQEKNGITYVLPIEGPENIDKRRSEAGMVPASFCAYISMFTPKPKTPLCDGL